MGLSWRIVRCTARGRRTIGYADTEVGADQARPLDRPGVRYVVEPPTARFVTRQTATADTGQRVEVRRRRSTLRWTGTLVDWSDRCLLLQVASNRVVPIPSADVDLVIKF